MNDFPALGSIDFDRSSIPQVPLDVIKYLMSLPEEVRVSLGNFLLDSAVEGFDGIAETSAQLWKNEMKSRIEDVVAHPERMIPGDEVLARLRNHLEQLRRTPHPDHLHGYHCMEYFGDGWAENGYYDEAAHIWLIVPQRDLEADACLGFFTIGGPGVDGIKFCFRYGQRGVWAFYPIENRFVFLAESIAGLLDGWNSGKITV